MSRHVTGTRRTVTLPTRVLALTVALAVVTVACGLPTDEEALPYNVDDLPDVLYEPTTTTTTTTTTLPPPTVPGETTTTTTSTTLPFPTVPVTVFYTVGSTNELRSIDIDQPGPQVPTRTVIQLLESPPEQVAFNLRSSVKPGLIDDVLIDLDQPVATIVLDPNVLERTSTAEQRRAIGQIVLTFTSFRTSDRGNIGFVQFQVDGNYYEVFVPSLNGSSQPGDLLDYTDYAELISTTATPTTSTSVASTTTSAVTTTTSVPETTVPGETTVPTSDPDG